MAKQLSTFAAKSQVEYTFGHNVLGSPTLKMVKSVTPWALFAASQDASLCFVLSKEFCKAALNKTKNKDTMQEICKRLSCFNPVIIIEDQDAVSFATYMYAQIISCTASDAAAYIFASNCLDKSYLSVDNFIGSFKNKVQVLPTMGDIVKTYLSGCNLTKNKIITVAFSDVLAGNFDYVYNIKSLKKIVKICICGKQQKLSSLCEQTNLEVPPLSDYPFYILNLIKYLNCRRPLNESDYNICYNKHGDCTINCFLQERPIKIWVVPEDNYLAALGKITNNSAGKECLTFLIKANSNFKTGEFSATLKNNLALWCLRCSQIEHMQNNSLYAGGFVNLDKTYILDKFKSYNSINKSYPTYVWQLVRNIASYLIIESGNNKALGELADNCGALTAGNMLDKIAQKQFIDASDCLLLLKEETSLRKEIISRIEMQHRIIDNCSVLLDVANSLSIKKLSASASIILEHQKVVLDRLISCANTIITEN